MNTKNLKKRIADSKLLSEAEKEYYTERLGEMNEEQMQKLGNILAEAEEIASNEDLQQYNQELYHNHMVSLSHKTNG